MLLRWQSPRVLGLLALAAVVAACVLNPPLLRDVRLGIFDRYQSAWPREYRPVPVRVVVIDDESLSRIGQWPWPRSVMRDLVIRLGDAGAAVIAMDIVFAERDRLSPARLAEQWPRVFDMDAGALRGMDTDRMLAEAAGIYPVVGGFALTQSGDPAPVPVKAGFAEVGVDTAAAVRGYPAALRNIPVLEEAFTGLGSFTVPAASGSVIRTLPLIQRQGEQLVPSLALETLRVASGADTIAVRGGADPSAGVRRLRTGRIEIPVTGDASLWLHDTGPVDARSIPAWRLLQGAGGNGPAVPRLQGHIVLIGTSAAALGDRVQTPLRPDAPAVTVHAQALEQMILGQHLERPAWARGAELSGAVILALLLVWLMPKLNVLGATGMALTLALLPIAAGAAGFNRYRLLLDPTPVVLTVLVVYLVMTVALFLLAEVRRRGIQRAFGQYLAPDLVAQLAEDPERLRLGGESRQMTFLFSDIAGFTALTETTDPQRLVALVNAYLEGACRVVFEHGGTIDKIVGDALHVMFNAPTDQPDHAARAVRCALALDEFSARFRAQQKEQGVEFGVTRIGVNSGPAIVGNFGGGDRFDYTAHGDAINTAARLEAANKMLGTTICAAGSVVGQCEAIAFRPIGVLWLRGKTTGTEVYQPLRDDDPRLVWRDEYLAVYEALRDGEPDARRRLEELTGRHPGDALLALHATRAAGGEQGVDIIVE
ncbi:MAG: adenylate/guanylate cyclase domain-containing protein [Gammaproteobacteria bacterium]|nr:adenylate/guanylate cyclase domain-containing protein [Gammaproteobacteria bacterium]